MLKRSGRRAIKLEENFLRLAYRFNQRIIPGRSEDIIFSVLTMTLQ